MIDRDHPVVLDALEEAEVDWIEISVLLYLVGLRRGFGDGPGAILPEALEVGTFMLREGLLVRGELVGGGLRGWGETATQAADGFWADVHPWSANAEALPPGTGGWLDLTPAGTSLMASKTDGISE